MSNRYYHHGCPKTNWDKGLEILPPEYKTMAESCIGKPDLDLMKDKTVQEGWVYFVTEKYSKNMQHVIELYLETLARESYGSW